jgi:hypothetical protein
MVAGLAAHRAVIMGLDPADVEDPHDPGRPGEGARRAAAEVYLDSEA